MTITLSLPQSPGTPYVKPTLANTKGGKSYRPTHPDLFKVVFEALDTSSGDAEGKKDEEESFSSKLIAVQVSLPHILFAYITWRKGCRKRASLTFTRTSHPTPSSHPSQTCLSPLLKPTRACNMVLVLTSTLSSIRTSCSVSWCATQLRRTSSASGVFLILRSCPPHLPMSHR